MSSPFLSLVAPRIARRNATTKISKTGDYGIRVYVGFEWFNLLKEGDRERLAIGLCHELPGHLLVATAKECGVRGSKSIDYRSKYRTFITGTDPALIRHLFPTRGDKIFVPEKVFLHTRSDGTKAIAFKWPGSVEYLQSLDTSVQKDGDDRSGEIETTPEPLHQMDSVKAPSALEPLAVDSGNVQPELDDQALINNRIGEIESNQEIPVEYVPEDTLSPEFGGTGNDEVIPIDPSPIEANETVGESL